MKRLLFVILATGVLTACATQYTAKQIGPFPSDSGGRMHSVLKPVLTKYGWLTCAKYDGRDERGNTVTGNFLFSFVDGRLNKEMTMADSDCYSEYKTGRLDFSYRF
jgi:hypothetical protein